MRIATVTLLAAALAAPTYLPTGPARAAESTSCDLAVDEVVIEPGVTTTTSRASFHIVRNGTITCHGPVAGRQPTGPGTWAATGTLEASCTGGKGRFTHTYRIPTADGPVTVTNTGPFTVGPLQGGVIGVQFDGDRMAGSMSALPRKGTCLTSPLTGISATGKGVLKN